MPLAVRARLGEAKADDAPREVTIDATLDATLGAGESVVIMVALTEDGIEHAIGAGENRGRRLRHDAVVRASATLETLTGPLREVRRMTGRLALTPEINPGRTKIVVWAQRMHDGQVIAASSVAISGDAVESSNTAPRSELPHRIDADFKRVKTVAGFGAGG